MTSIETPLRNAECQWAGHPFTFTGLRRPKYCPQHKAAAERQQDRERKAAYAPCWQCGKRRPLWFDRYGLVEADFEIPACFCGVICWVHWWDEFADAARAAYEPLPYLYRVLDEHRSVHQVIPDYRGERTPKGGTFDRNETPAGDIESYNWGASPGRNHNTVPSSPQIETL